MWQHFIGQNGYGQSWDAIAKEVKGSHVMMWEFVNGSADGNDICHSCDVRCCINIEHLFKGSRADNLADMRAKSRGVNPPKLYGDAHPGSKITDTQIAEIREKYSGIFGEKAELAREYKVSKTQIANILSRRQRA